MICVDVIHVIAVNVLVDSLLKSVLTVQLRISDHQCERRVFDLSPVKVAFHSRCSALWIL